jgi:hypothetical protein
VRILIIGEEAWGIEKALDGDRVETGIDREVLLAAAQRVVGGKDVD